MNNTTPSCGSFPCAPAPRAFAALLLRLALGLCLLWAGLHKFGVGDPKSAGATASYKATVAGLTGMFNGTLLGGFPSSAFAHALPFLEAGVGLLLLIGLRTRCALMLGGLTLIGLAFGLMVLGNKEMMTPQLFIFVLILMNAVALALLESGNTLSVDTCRGSCTSAHKP